MNAPAAHLRARHAFTLLELMIIIVLMGILAATAIPAFATANQTRGIAATREVERRFVHARARAMSTGQPTGIGLDTSGNFSVWRIATAGAVPSAAPTSTGEPGTAWQITSAYAGVTIASITGGDGSHASSQTIWFGFDGTPELRSASGTRTGGFNQDALVTLAGPGVGVVKILKGSGVVER